MRFWLTKNSELPLREQLVRQVVLAILSEDLPAGQKLPSTRSIARRYRIHANTVSAAWHQLLEQGWLELRRGSGVYVRSSRPAQPLDVLIARLLADARKLGHEPDDVIERLQRTVHPQRYAGVNIIEPEAEMRAILSAEIGIEPHEGPVIMAALQTSAASVKKHLATDTPLFVLRLRSVRQSLEGETRPGANAILTVVSASRRFREGARAMLLAVGIEPDCLAEVDTGIDGWHDRVRAGSLAIVDVLAAGVLPAGCPFRVFRLVADSSIAELRQMCGCDARE